MIYFIVHFIFQLYIYLLLAYCISSFLPHSAYRYAWVRKLISVIFILIEPAMRLLHSIIPQRFLSIGIIDISPIILCFALQFLERGIIYLLMDLGI